MTRHILIATILAFSAAPSLALARQDSAASDTHIAPRDVSHYNIEKGNPAIQGYDPVAYFPEAGGKPVKGNKQFQHTHRGVMYWFSSKANLDRFTSDPDRFEPTYGGWCASAMADGGRKVEVDPTNFKVTDGRLFLFYKSFFQDALDYWVKDEPGHTTSADAQWKTLTGESPANK